MNTNRKNFFLTYSISKAMPKLMLLTPYINVRTLALKIICDHVEDMNQKTYYMQKIDEIDDAFQNKRERRRQNQVTKYKGFSRKEYDQKMLNWK